MPQSATDHPHAGKFGPQDNSRFVWVLVAVAVAGCAIFAISILIADRVVPNHDWIADTISDLGAGKYEYIVDTGIYAFSSAMIAMALAAAHLHQGGARWSLGIVGLAAMGQIIFLVGARNEYGDNDNEGVVIHVYLVYALGLLMTLTSWAMSSGAASMGEGYRKTLLAICVIWTLSAPVFFFMSTDWDGVYERYLGLIAFALVLTLARFAVACARADSEARR